VLHCDGIHGERDMDMNHVACAPWHLVGCDTVTDSARIIEEHDGVATAACTA
jgi:hypothetical protein